VFQVDAMKGAFVLMIALAMVMILRATAMSAAFGLRPLPLSDR
jgi:hypothetical protein